MKTFKLYILLIVLTTGSLCFSQSQKKADGLYENRAYVEAAEIYSQLPKNNLILEKLGDCYYYNSEYEKAYEAYSQIKDLSIESDLTEEFYIKSV